jgi:hypothetical protein
MPLENNVQMSIYFILVQYFQNLAFLQGQVAFDMDLLKINS